MIRCDDIGRLLAWLIPDPVRFRHMIHDLDSPCPAWDEAMARCDGVPGTGFVLRDRPVQPRLASECHVDSLADISLVARVQGKCVQVEGRMTDPQAAAFVPWCRDCGIETVQTYSPVVHERLAAGGVEPWQRSGGDYTTGGVEFRDRGERVVRRLTAADEGPWRRFVERNASDPMVNGWPGSQAAVRDFIFMCRGLPVDYYAAVDGGEIAGVISVNPMTRTVDEISMLFVDPRHRRKGYANSLMTAATRGILSRGHMPAYHATDNPSQRPDLHAMLTGLGYRLVVCAWETRLG